MLSEITRQHLERLHRIQILFIDLDILFMLIVSQYVSNTYKKSYFQVFIIVLVISIIVHRT